MYYVVLRYKTDARILRNFIYTLREQISRYTLYFLRLDTQVWSLSSLCQDLQLENLPIWTLLLPKTMNTSDLICFISIESTIFADCAPVLLVTLSMRDIMRIRHVFSLIFSVRVYSILMMYVTRTFLSQGKTSCRDQSFVFASHIFRYHLS